jgi:hypothetical protein
MTSFSISTGVLKMRGMKIALDKFYEGACKEGHNAAMVTADPEKSWQLCDRADWMLWLLRRQCSVLKLQGAVRDVVRVFDELMSEVDYGDYGPKSKEEHEIRMKFLEYGANVLRQHLPNPFTPEGYAWMMKGEPSRTALASQTPTPPVGPLRGEDAWLDELIECAGQRNPLRTVLRAFAANLRQQPVGPTSETGSIPAGAAGDLRYCGKCNQRRYFRDGKCEVCALEPDTREMLAQWMIQHGFATGRGDTFQDLLDALTWQVAEGRNPDERKKDTSRFASGNT